MINKKIKISTSITLVVILLIFALAVINYFSQKNFIRFDLTEGKIYTLSETSKNIAKNLDDIVTVKVYFSKKLPPQLIPLKEQLDDYLKEYQAYAGEKLRIEYIDPSEDKEMEEKVRALGVPQIQMNIFQKDKTEVMNGYLGIGIFYTDKKEIIPVVQTDNFEYDFSSALKKVTSDEIKSIGFLMGHDERDFYKDYYLARTALEKQYKIKPVFLNNEKTMPDNISTLIIAGPKKTIPPKELFKIDQFLMKGGNLYILIDQADVNQNLQAQDLNTGLDQLIENYGIQVKHNLVLDPVCEKVSFNMGFFSYVSGYPFWIKAMNENFDKKNPILNRLESIVLPWTSSIELLTGALKNKEVVELAKSSSKSFIQEGFYILDPRNFQNIPPTPPKSELLAVSLTGNFTSYYKDKPIPAEEKQDKKDKKPEIKPIEEKIEESKKASILVVGSSRFISNENVQRFPQNMVFFQNATDWLMQSKDLISIRSRAKTERLLKEEISEKEKNIIKFTNIFMIPILVIAIGIIRFLIRRKVKRINS